jgi:hypothetical protein
MATDIEKTTALINGIVRDRYPTGTDKNLLDGYTLDIANVHRTNYRLDDATATTQAWLFSVGGTNANPSIFTIGAGLTLSINTSGVVAIVGTDPASTAIATAATRGAVRRLVAPLGITLTAPG